jgi:diguanylate cyclase (GGDEF)-like protein
VTESEDVDAELQVTLGWLRLPQRRSTALLRLATLLTIGFVIADLAARHLRFDMPVVGDVWQPGLDSIAFLLPAMLVLVRAGFDQVRWPAWVALALGLVGRAVGSALAWTFPHAPAPSPADAARSAGALLVIVAVVILTQKHSSQVLRSVRLDGAITGLSVGAVALAMWFDPILRVSGDAGAVAIAMAYPLADVVLLVLIVAGLAPQRFRPAPSSVAMLLGVALQLAADVAHLSLVSRAIASQPLWLTDARLVGATLIALSAWLPLRLRHPRPERATAGLSGVPIVFSLVSIGVLGWDIDHDVNVLGSILALAAVSLVILRTALTVRELRRANESFLQARTDELTGLTNRRGFIESLDRILDVAPNRVAVIIVDLNGFKDVNDSLGHHAGDDLLRQAAARFRTTVGDGTLLARLGGDEFGVVMMVNDPGAGMLTAHELRQSLDEAFTVDGVTVRVGGAFGVAIYPTHGRSRSSVLRCADVAMYDAKREQTGVAMYRQVIDFNSRDKLQLLDDLRRAIDERALELHYQPQIGLRDGMISGAEALVRWRHPTRGLLYPDSFVPLAERAGLIPGITRAVLAQAIEYHAENFPHMSVSVNISHRDLVDDSLAEYLADLLTIYRYDPGLLTLEITETALAHDPVRAARSIESIRKAGMKLAIDDFGVGYSSMARLLEQPVDEVKIDKSFVLAIENDPRAIAVVRSTVQLAAALELKVVAEGVENADVLRQITEAGVDIGQGYFIGRPIPTARYSAFLRTCGPNGPQIAAEQDLPFDTPYLPAGPSSGLFHKH